MTFCPPLPSFLQQQYHSKIDVLIDEALKDIITSLVSKVNLTFTLLRFIILYIFQKYFSRERGQTILFDNPA